MHVFSYNMKFHKIQNSLQASVPFIESLWDFTQKKERWGGQLSRMILKGEVLSSLVKI